MGVVCVMVPKPPALVGVSPGSGPMRGLTVCWKPEMAEPGGKKLGVLEML